MLFICTSFSTIQTKYTYIQNSFCKQIYLQNVLFGFLAICLLARFLKDRISSWATKKTRFLKFYFFPFRVFESMSLCVHIGRSKGYIQKWLLLGARVESFLFIFYLLHIFHFSICCLHSQEKLTYV